MYTVSGTLEAKWQDQGTFFMQILAPYRRYTFRMTQQVLENILTSNIYIGDKILVYVDNEDVVKAELFNPAFSIIKPDLTKLSILGELGGAL